MKDIILKHKWLYVVLLPGIVMLPSCGGSTSTEQRLTPADEQTVAAISTIVSDNPQGCDLTDARHCLLPYPSNAYTATDSTSAETGIRVSMPVDGMPATTKGTPIDPSEWNRNDGFSPNSSIMAFFADLDAANSELPSWTDLETSLDTSSHVVVLDMTTGTRIPAWAELDVKAESDSQLLVIHPAVVLPEAHEIAVALRGLKTTAGVEVDVNPVFRAYRDGLQTDIASVESRRDALERVFSALESADIDRKDLQLAWSFTVASERNLSERMLSIRDAGLATIATSLPKYTITEVAKNPREDVAIQISGTFESPNFLEGNGEPGNGFNYADGDTSADRVPVQNGTMTAPFMCNIAPASLESGAAPVHLALYGHGLLGSHEEIDYGGDVREFAQANNILFCATKWSGMSEDDVTNSIRSLRDLSNFRTNVDRMQQGILNFMVLGKLMLDPEGFRADPAFAGLAFEDALYYDGNSQGGIMGGALVAVSPDIQRAVLGVTGINYSLLLPRSVDFNTYEAVMKPSYPSAFDRMLIIGLMQMLWDRGEGGGYAQHVTSNAYPGTGPKSVLLHVALGDWQVSELAAMVQARAYGASAHSPVVADGRSHAKELAWGISPIASYPFEGSAIVVWDSGSDIIPIDAIPPSTSRDPHEDPREYTDAQKQKAEFLFGGKVIDVCNGGPCSAPSSD